MNNEFVVGAVFFILGLISAYFFYVKSIKVKDPFYFIENIRVMYDYQSDIPNLKFTYKNKKVENLSVATLVFYNNGAETITKQDIETINHLRIVANNDVKILDVALVKSNNPASNFSITLDNNQATINFDYINKNQGAVISITYTGKTKEDISLVGDIMGVNKLSIIPKRTKLQEFIYNFLTKMSDWEYVRKIFFPYFIVIMLAATLLGVYIINSPSTHKIEPDTSIASRITASIIYVLFVGAWTSITMFFTKIVLDTKHNKLPKGLEY